MLPISNPPGFTTARTLNQIITYDAYHMAEVFLTQAFEIVAGSEALFHLEGSGRMKVGI
jgi:hypothetical protein